MTSHFFARLGLGVLVLYLAYVCMFFLLQRKVVFPRHLYGHGVTLNRAAENSIMISYDCGHNDCPPDWSAFWEAVASFLRSAGIMARSTRTAS